MGNPILTPDFMAAPVEDKVGYLSSIDKDFAHAQPQDQIQYMMHIGAIPGMPPSHVDMQTSSVPEVTKAGMDALPVVGGLAGAVTGAGAGGLGAVAGGGLGTAGGETLRQMLMNKMFGEGPTPLSKQGLQQTAIAGGMGAASEIPGAIATGIGNRVIGHMIDSVPAGQTGNAMRALESVTPAGAGSKGLQMDLETGRRALVDKLDQLASQSTGMGDLDQLVSSARNQAIQAESTVPGTLKRFDKIIAAAKVNAGITGNQATAQQMLAFQKQLSKPAYTGNPGPVSEVLANLLGHAYSGVGQGVEQAAPGAAKLMSDMSDIYAAKAGVKAYFPNRAQSLAVTSALHPRTTALVSPVVTGAAAMGADEPKKRLSQVGNAIVP